MSRAYVVEQDFANVDTSTGAGLVVRASLVDNGDNQVFTPVLTVHVDLADDEHSTNNKIAEAVQAFADSQSFALEGIILLPSFRKIG